jgi:hypothetical protein
MEPKLETANWLGIPVPPGKEDTMENTDSSFRSQRVEDPFQTNVSVIDWLPGDATGATLDSSDPLSMLIERAIELVASKTDLTDMFKNSNLSAKTSDFIMDFDSAVQRIFREVDIQQDDTDDSIPDLVTLIQAAVSGEIVGLLNDTMVPELVSAMNRFVQTRIASNGQALLGLLDKIDTSSGEQLIVMQDKSKLQRLNTLTKSIIDCRTQIDATTHELQIESGHCVRTLVRTLGFIELTNTGLETYPYSPRLVRVTSLYYPLLGTMLSSSSIICRLKSRPRCLRLQELVVDVAATLAGVAASKACNTGVSCSTLQPLTASPSSPRSGVKLVQRVPYPRVDD